MSRIFVKFDNDAQSYQILSIHQSRNGGDIYCGLPNGRPAYWHGFLPENSERLLLLRTSTSNDDGAHLSVHGSGQTHVKYEKMSRRSIAVLGNKLSQVPEKELGIRHLFTALPSKPAHLPVGRQQRDVTILSNGPMRPFALICFAVPKGIGQVSLHFSFHEDELETDSPDAGMAWAELGHHRVVMLAYGSKMIEKWPDNTIIQYSDGYLVPFIRRLKPGNISVDLQKPTYKLNGEELTIVLPGPQVEP